MDAAPFLFTRNTRDRAWHEPAEPGRRRGSALSTCGEIEFGPFTADSVLHPGRFENNLVEPDG